MPQAQPRLPRLQKTKAVDKKVLINDAPFSTINVWQMVDMANKEFYMHTRIVGALALIAIMASSVIAQDKNPPKPDEPTPAQQVTAVTQEYQTAYNDFIQKYSAAAPEDRQELLQEMPQPSAYAERLMDIANKYPDDPAALDALVWVVTRAGGPNATQAIKVIAERHYRSDKIADIFQSLTRSPSQATEDFFDKVLAENPDHNVQGQACYALAGYLKQLTEYAGMLDGERADAIRQSLGDEATDYLAKRAQSEMISTEIEQLLERTVDEFGDVAVRNKTLKEMAERELFEIRHLAIGMMAPEVEGEDVEGESFKLADYRGKVVMLDFWGDW